MRLDKQNPVPLYRQLKDALLKMIEEDYQPGEVLPSEGELEQMFNVSRMTVRLAMNGLAEEGFVERQRGRGTFVLPKKLTHNLSSITSWTQQILDLGLSPMTKEIELETLQPSKKIAQLMDMNDSETLVRIKRIRYADNEPMCIMVNYLRESFVPGIVEKGFSEESLYEFLRREYGVYLVKADETVEAREASELEAEVLGIKSWSPVLFVTRRSYLATGTLFELVHVVSRADRYRYNITLHATPFE